MRIRDVAELARRLGPVGTRRERWSLAVAIVVAASVAVLGAVLVGAVPQAAARVEGLTPGPAGSHPYAWGVSTSVHHDRAVRVLVLGAGAPALPGSDVVLADGEALVSPALRDALRADPALEARIPGRVVGTLTSADLIDPQGLEAIAADRTVSLPYSGTGWGRRGADAPGALPVVPTRLILLLLLLLPAAATTATVARVHAGRLRRQCAVLTLLGADRAVVARVVAAVTCRSAVAAALCGGVLGWLAVEVGGPRGWWGFAYFPPSAPALGLHVLVVVGTAVGLVVVTGWAAVRPVGADLVAVRDDRDWVPRPALVAALAACVVLLALVAVRWSTADPAVPSSTTTLLFLVTSCVALLGVPVVAAAVVRAAAGRVGSRSSLPLLLAVRHVRRWPGDLMSRTAAIAALATVVVVAGGAVLVTEDTGRPLPGAVWIASMYDLDDAQTEAAARVAGDDGVLALQDESGTTVHGTCEAFDRVAGGALGPGGTACVDGITYPRGELGVRDPRGGLAVPGPTGTADRVVTSVPSASARGGARRHVYLQMVVPDLEAWQDALLQVTPVAAFTPASGDATTLTVLPAVRRLLDAVFPLGLVVTTLTFLLAGHPGDRRLQRLGAPSAVQRRASTVRSALTAGVACMAGSGAALLCGQAYLALASTYRVDLGTVSTLVVGSVLVVVLTSAVAAVAGSPRED